MMEQISRVLQQGNLIKTSVNDNGTATIQLHRPEKRNALSQAMIDELVAVIDLVEKHDNTRVVVLTGAPGGPFSAGADIKELSALNTTQAYERNWLKDLSDAVQGMRKPIICVVEGLAFGGGFELALLCDIIYASSSARFGLLEVTISTIPVSSCFFAIGRAVHERYQGMGGTQRLVRAIGKHKAMELVLSGESISAAEAERLGLISKVITPEEYPDQSVLEVAQALAAKIAGMSAPVVRAAKCAILAAETSAGLEKGLEAERALYCSTFGLVDFRESTSAFLGKRQATVMHR